MDVTADKVRRLAEAAAAYDDAYEAAFGRPRNFGIRCVVVEDPSLFAAAAEAVGARPEKEGTTLRFDAFGCSFLAYEGAGL